MDLHSFMDRLLRYDDWANREALAALKRGAASRQSLQLFAHIVASERLWLDRLERARQSVDPWPDWDLERSAALLEALLPSWREVLGEHSGAALESDFTYTNTKGERWTSTVLDTVTHVLLHSAYHRGQIAMGERTSGREPAYTDFIHCARRGYIA